MLPGSLLFIALAAFFLAGVWWVLYTPSSRTCKVRLEAMGETIRNTAPSPSTKGTRYA